MSTGVCFSFATHVETLTQEQVHNTEIVQRIVIDRVVGEIG